MEIKYAIVIHVISSVFVKGYRCPQRHLFVPLSVEFRFIAQSHKTSWKEWNPRPLWWK